jgi:hypothetical protein
MPLVFDVHASPVLYAGTAVEPTRSLPHLAGYVKKQKISSGSLLYLLTRLFCDLVLF